MWLELDWEQHRHWATSEPGLATKAMVMAAAAKWGLGHAKVRVFQDVFDESSGGFQARATHLRGPSPADDVDLLRQGRPLCRVSCHAAVPRRKLEVLCQEVLCGVNWHMLGSRGRSRTDVKMEDLASAEAACGGGSPASVWLLKLPVEKGGARYVEVVRGFGVSAGEKALLEKMKQKQRRRFALAAIVMEMGAPSEGGALAEEMRAIDLRALRDGAGRPVLAIAIAEQRPREGESAAARWKLVESQVALSSFDAAPTATITATAGDGDNPAGFSR
eukprot:jgi/Tetstr1/458144/TSEL_044636.t1